MNSEEILKLKNSLARKDVIKILIYSILTIIIVGALIDGILNNEIANITSRIDEGFYYFCITNKTLIMGIIYIIIFSLISFLVIRNSNKYMIEVITNIEQILKDADKEIKLSDDLAILESQLNNVRIDLIRNQDAAKEANQKKDNLIMYMAHDLKTPLTSIIGYLTLLTQEKKISKEMQEKYINIALEKSLRVEDLTNQFFEITRYNLQDMPITKDKIDLSFLLDQLVDECYPMLQEKKLKYKIEKPEHVYFLGDGDKLARAFGNLIKNAINYSFENSEIEIELKKDKEKIQIKFKNEGDKIPKYKLDKIFEKFYRLDDSRATNTGGTGLGLAITKEIIELHEGEIFVKNNNHTIEFYIELKAKI